MKILTKIRRYIKRLDPNCVLWAERDRYCNKVIRMIRKTRYEADCYDKEGRHDLARKYRHLADCNEIRLKITLLI